MKDKRYTIAKNLILTGHVKSFRDIFEIVPKSTVSRDLGMNYIRFFRLINNVNQFFLTDIFRIAALLEISNSEMVKIIYDQYEADQKRKFK